MNTLSRIWYRLGRDRIFWAVLIGVFVLYAVLELDSAWSFIATLIGLLMAITIHECAHAYSADQLGDPTARLMGRVTLNPIRHLDPLGTIMMVVTALTGFGIGWGKPTPVTPYRLRYGSRAGGALVSLAGPVSNLLLAMVLGLVLRLTAPLLLDARFIIVLLLAIVQTNIVIAFFNLIPIPPLDGFTVAIGLFSLIGMRWAWSVVTFMEGLRRYGFMILIGVIIFSRFLGINIIGGLIGPPTRLFSQLILGT